MQLSEILNGIETSSRISDVEIKSISTSVKNAGPGCLFVCLPGKKTVLRSSAAVLRGAKAVICKRKLPLPIPQIIVKNVREALSIACSNFYGRPTEKMMMIGVTGTNGKTSTTFMTKAVLEANGIKTGLIGTIQCMAGDEKLEKVDEAYTTPRPMTLYPLLARMLEAGCKAVVMEVVSEAMASSRVAGIRYDVGIFTNLTQDHLDFHGTMEQYASEKRKLFAICKSAAFNVDAEYCEFMRTGYSGRTLTYGIHQPADVKAQDITYATDRVTYTMQTAQGSFPVEVPIPGEFTVYNSLACASACLLLGMDPESIVAGMRSIQHVPGRIERIPDLGLPFSVIIDYAHTPDGIENILRAVRGITTGRVITLFGCGGNRDKTKRPQMGYAAGRLSDYCIVTSDNPRYEDPQAIIEDILPGIRESGCEFEVEVSRTAAIEKALACAQAGDTVVLAGKGHEQYQIVNGMHNAFDEKAIVREAAAKLTHSA